MTTMARILILTALAAGVVARAGGALASSHEQAVAAAKKEIDGYDETIDRLRKEALDAFANDNCIALNNRRNQLNELRLKIRDPAFADAFYGRHGQTIPALATASLISNVRPDLRTLRDKLEKTTSELFALRCPKVDPAQAGKTQVQVGGGVQFKRLPKRNYLGREVLGSGNLELGLVNPDRTASGPTGSVSVKTTLSAEDSAKIEDGAESPVDRLMRAFGWFPVLDPSEERRRTEAALSDERRLREIWAKVTGSHAQARANQNFAEIDPAGGLPIPGPNGGASGFFLSANPANIVRDASYSVDLKKTGVSVALGETVTQGDRSASVYIMGGYSYLTSDEQFSGEIPGFLRNFAYRTDVDVNQVQLRAGAEMVQAFEMAFGMLQVGGRVEIGPEYSRGRGDDRLDFTGFPQSRQSLSESKIDFGGLVGVFANVVPTQTPGIGIQAFFAFGRETGLPVVSRNGNDPSQLGLQSAISAFAGLSLIGVF